MVSRYKSRRSMLAYTPGQSWVEHQASGASSVGSAQLRPAEHCAEAAAVAPGERPQTQPGWESNPQKAAA